MGHSIQYYTFDKKDSKEKIQNVCDYYAIDESNNRSSLPSQIRFIENSVYQDEDKAYEAIKNFDKGYYDQLAVLFYHYEKRKETKEITNLRERIKKTHEALENFQKTHAIKNRKSEFASCPNCKSKINKNYVSDSNYLWNMCPLCRTDMSSKSTKESLERKRENISKLEKMLEEAIKKNNAKGKSTVKWLVKTEFHV